MFYFHVATEVAFQIELTGTIGTFKGLVSSMEVHVAQQVVHSVERFPTNLYNKIQVDEQYIQVF